jgi:hypothetical protein
VRELRRNPPVSFSEKVRAKMLMDRRPLLQTFADKIAVRGYVERKVGPGVLTKLFVVTEDPEAIRREDLPVEFALKATHGSGGCVLVGEHAPLATTLPLQPLDWGRILISPGNVDWHLLRRMCDHWLGLRYPEWAHLKVPPRILVEELLVEDGSIPRNYHFFVFDGRVRMVDVLVGRYGNAPSVNLYTPTWESIPVDYWLPRGPGVERPSQLDEMIRVAGRLGEGVDFVRVDLYQVGDRVVFGELTNYPGAGLQGFPDWFDDEVGSWWSFPWTGGKY